MRPWGTGDGDVVVTVHEMPAADIRSCHGFIRRSGNRRIRVMPACRFSIPGMGMDATTLDRVFDPFFSTKFTGRGLGLPLVLGVVKAHEGAVTVESSPGRGAVFHVFLPLLAEDLLSRKKEPAGAVPSEKRGTVMLVDDEPMLRHMVGVMLRRLGYSVMTASDGMEALETFRKHQDRGSERPSGSLHASHGRMADPGRVEIASARPAGCPDQRL